MIEIKQRLKCGACRSFEGGVTAKCRLGYDIKQINVMGVGVNAKPLEPCPKPLTYSELLEAEKLYRKIW